MENAGKLPNDVPVHGAATELSSRRQPPSSGHPNVAQLTGDGIANSPRLKEQQQLVESIANSPRMVAQRQRLGNVFDPAPFQPAGTGKARKASAGVVQAKLTPKPQPGTEKVAGPYFDDFLGAYVTIQDVIQAPYIPPVSQSVVGEQPNAVKKSKGGIYMLYEGATGQRWHYNEEIERYSPNTITDIDGAVNEYKRRLADEDEAVVQEVLAQLKKISTLEVDKAVTAGKGAQGKILNSILKYKKGTTNAWAAQVSGKALAEESHAAVLEEVNEAILTRIEEIVVQHIEEKRALYVTPEGKMKNGDRAEVPVAKLTGYCLKADHDVGKFKAKVFKDLLGVTAENYQVLDAALRLAARNDPAEVGATNSYGQSITVYFQMQGVGEKSGNTGTVCSGWFYAKDADKPKLASCYVVPGKGIAYKAYFADNTLVAEDDWPPHLVDPMVAYKSGKRDERTETRVTLKTGRLYQTRTYDARGYPLWDFDYTSPSTKEGDPHLGGEGGEHMPPGHKHKWTGDPEEGFARGPAEPM